MFPTFISDNYFRIVNTELECFLFPFCYFRILSTDLQGFLVPFWLSVKWDITRFFSCLKIQSKCWIESA